MKLQEQFIIQIELLSEKIKNNSEYPFSLSSIKSLKTLLFHSNVTFLVGENGSGKSTLLEAIATGYGFNPEGGSKNLNFSTQKTHSDLHKYLRISKGYKFPKDGYFLRAESFYNVATDIDRIAKDDPSILEGYGGKSLHKQSHGESFFSLFLDRFGSEGVYILDEPEAALSPQKLLSFLVRLDELVKSNSQFIIATHSPILLAYPNAIIYEATDSGFIQKEYNDLDQINLYKDFLNNPEYMCKKLGI